MSVLTKLYLLSIYLTNHKTKSLLPAVAFIVVLLNGSAKLGVLPSNVLLVLKKIENKSIVYSLAKFGRVDHQSLYCNALKKCGVKKH